MSKMSKMSSLLNFADLALHLRHFLLFGRGPVEAWSEPFSPGPRATDVEK